MAERTLVEQDRSYEQPKRTADSAVIALLSKIKAASNGEEIDRLTEELQPEIFRLQYQCV